MDLCLKLVGYIFRFIINKLKKMKIGEDKKMKEEKFGNVLKVVGFLVVGAVVGLVVGILLVFDKGKKIRVKLLEDVKDLIGKLKKKVEDGIDFAVNVVIVVNKE